MNAIIAHPPLTSTVNMRNAERYTESFGAFNREAFYRSVAEPDEPERIELLGPAPTPASIELDPTYNGPLVELDRAPEPMTKWPSWIIGGRRHAIELDTEAL